MRGPLLILLLTAALAAIPGVGDAARRQAPEPEPWATVNVCDTENRPNELGIRGGMPGLARSTRMYMRFRVQYRAAAAVWRDLKRGPLSDSGWQKVATGRRGQYDAGWSFEFEPPASGGADLLRGIVSFEWRRHGNVVLRDRRITEAGHPGTAGADPAGFSAATCAIA